MLYFLQKFSSERTKRTRRQQQKWKNEPPFQSLFDNANTASKTRFTITRFHISQFHISITYNNCSLLRFSIYHKSYSMIHIIWLIVYGPYHMKTWCIMTFEKPFPKSEIVFSVADRVFIRAHLLSFVRITPPSVCNITPKVSQIKSFIIIEKFEGWFYLRCVYDLKNPQ